MSSLNSFFQKKQEGVTPHLPFTVEKFQYRATIQPFSHGGYEAVLKFTDVEKVAASVDAAYYEFLRKPRVPRDIDDRNKEDIERAAQRAKKTVRHKCKEMGADRLLTLTTRAILSIDDLLTAWQKFLYLVERATGERLLYLTVPEPHPSNPEHLHLHVAINTYLKVEIIRKCWHAALRAGDAAEGSAVARGAASPGNIDIQWIKVKSKHQVMSRVARYISKYITKDCLQRFNKKRYWSTKGVQLLEVRRIWLKSMSAVDAFQEFRRMMGLEGMDAFHGLVGGNSFFAPSGDLVWLQYVPGEVIPDPPPF